MKALLRSYIINLFTLWFTSRLVSGFKLAGNYQTFILGAAALTLILIFIKPLVKLLFLPINFLTLGLFSWITNVIILYLLTIFVPQIKVLPFKYPGFSHQGFTIPEIYFGTFESFVITSFIISLITNFLAWLYR